MPEYFGERFMPQPEYSGREIWAQARVHGERNLGLSQSTLGEGFGPEPEYSGSGFWASVVVILERDLALSLSTQEERFAIL